MNSSLRSLQRPNNSEANHRRDRITDSQELRNRHLHALRRTRHISQRNQDHSGRASRHKHHAEPQHRIRVEELGLRSDGPDEGDADPVGR
jgi:hypothetical protein